MNPVSQSPGVYVGEVSAPGAPGVAPAPTSIAAFVGRTERGRPGVPATVRSATDFHAAFGGCPRDRPAPWCVRQFFANGGGEAVVLRLSGAGAAPATLLVAREDRPEAGFTLTASSPGAWGNGLEAEVTVPASAGQGYGFDLVVTDTADGSEEEYEDVSLDPASGARYLGTVLAAQSRLVSYPAPAVVPPAPWDEAAGSGSGGADGARLTTADYLGDGATTGLFALGSAEVVNLVSIPPDEMGGDTAVEVYQAAAAYAVARGAMLLMDAPVAWEGLVRDGSAGEIGTGVFGFTPEQAGSSALYFPRVVVPDPSSGGDPLLLPASGAVAGVFARTDRADGVWHAPAGLQAQLEGVSGTAVPMSDATVGTLGPRGIDAIRTLPDHGTAVWGARTLAGADGSGDPYRYVQVRRTVTYIEQSLRGSLTWTTFEADTPALRARVSALTQAFLSGLYAQGALMGDQAAEAYHVTCDASNNPPGVDPGTLHLAVAVALVRPAEFILVDLTLAVAVE